MHILDFPVEVFVLIFKFLESRDLLRCAIVCSQWRDLALDIKWKEHMVDWVYLLQALGPRNPCFDEDQYSWEAKHSSIKEATASPGWRRLNELRQKVTRLRIGTHLASEDIDYLLKLHEEESPHPAFCPQLRELEVSFGDLKAYEYDFITGASLRQFWLNWIIDTDGPTRLIADTIEKVASRSPMVEHVRVSYSDSPFINYGKFSKLRILAHFGEFSVASWIQLCTGCLLLENLTIWWKERELVDEEHGAIGSQVQQLPVLRFLRIATSGDHGGVLKSYILRTTNMPQLRELKVDLQTLGYTGANGLLSSLPRRCPLLTKLQVGGHVLEWSVFGLFRGLRELKLSGTLGSWTTEHVEGIIQNLPNLTRLSIVSNIDIGVDRTQPAFTPATIETIATRCQLYQLRIPLNALEISWISEPPTPAAKFDLLVELTLDPLHVETNDVGPLAKYLALLCPTVNRFEPTPVHPYETLPGQSIPWYSTEEEESNREVMRNQFFDAQRKDVVFQRVSEVPK